MEFDARNRGHDSHEEMIRTGDTGGGQMAVDDGPGDAAAETAAEISRLENVQQKDRQIAQQQAKLAGGGSAKKSSAKKSSPSKNGNVAGKPRPSNGNAKGKSAAGGRGKRGAGSAAR